MLTEHSTKFKGTLPGGCDSVSLYSGLRALACAMSLLVIAGCAGDTGSRAPVNDLNQSGASGVARSYTVKPGDTLVKISRSTGVDDGAIIRLNKLSDPNRLLVGQVLKLSDGTDSGAGSVPPSGRPEARPLDMSDSAASADSTPARASDAGIISWGWPAQGKVIQSFSSSTKGIDIGGNSGDPVVAAANGQVMYSGNGVRGLGNLVIIDHKDGFITAYAHNRSLVVKKDQMVKKGAKIAEMGQTDAASVRLHFEVRRQGSPVDPLQYLPAK